MRSILTVSILLVGSLTGSLWAAQQQFDLGGACSAAVSPGPFSQLREAKKGGNWDRVIEVAKQNVREGCGVEYRWGELVNALLEAHRPAEALQALQEMDSRGFDLNPSAIDSGQEELKAFMDAPLFKASPVGRKVEQLKRISDERRDRYREVLKTIPPSQRPPDDYVAKGVCPFECCHYGNWTALEDTELVATPGGKRVVGKAAKGNRVVGLTGEVHLRPEPVVVLTAGALPKDSIAFVLDYGGEGYGHVFTRGKVVDVFLGYGEYCFRPSEDCWGETLLPAKERKKQVWWVQVRLANGATGWTDKPENFGGKDACGG